MSRKGKTGPTVPATHPAHRGERLCAACLWLVGPDGCVNPKCPHGPRKEGAR